MSTGATTLAGFIGTLTPVNGHTYVGYNAADTFIVTDYNSHIGAVEVVGIFTHSTVSNHVLTLVA